MFCFIFAGTFSPDFDDDFDEDFASMLGGNSSHLSNTRGGGGGARGTPSSGPLGHADESGISTYEMEDETKDEFDFDTDF